MGGIPSPIPGRPDPMASGPRNWTRYAPVHWSPWRGAGAHPWGKYHPCGPRPITARCRPRPLAFSCTTASSCDPVGDPGHEATQQPASAQSAILTPPDRAPAPGNGPGRGAADTLPGAASPPTPRRCSPRGGCPAPPPRPTRGLEGQVTVLRVHRRCRGRGPDRPLPSRGIFGRKNSARAQNSSIADRTPIRPPRPRSGIPVPGGAVCLSHCHVQTRSDPS
jgi:hypothetical protein